MSFVAITIMDEPASREDVTFNAAGAVKKESAALLAELAKHEERQAQGTLVKDDTVNAVLEKGRELREKLRTLRTLLGLEVSEVEEQLGELQTNVVAFLDRNAAAAAKRAEDAAAKQEN